MMPRGSLTHLTPNGSLFEAPLLLDEKGPYTLNMKGGKIYDDIHLNDELIIPRSENDEKSECFKVLSVGKDSRSSICYLTLENEGKPKVYRLPRDQNLELWCTRVISSALSGKNFFPSMVEFGRNGNGYWAKIKTAENFEKEKAEKTCYKWNERKISKWKGYLHLKTLQIAPLPSEKDTPFQEIEKDMYVIGTKKAISAFIRENSNSSIDTESTESFGMFENDELRPRENSKPSIDTRSTERFGMFENDEPWPRQYFQSYARNFFKKKFGKVKHCSICGDTEKLGDVHPWIIPTFDSSICRDCIRIQRNMYGTKFDWSHLENLEKYKKFLISDRKENR